MLLFARRYAPPPEHDAVDETAREDTESNSYHIGWLEPGLHSQGTEKLEYTRKHGRCYGAAPVRPVADAVDRAGFSQYNKNVDPN